MTNWKTAQQNMACREGWGIFDNSDHGLRIERVGGRFYSDAAAQTYVALEAMNGSTLHVQAVNFLGQELLHQTQPAIWPTQECVAGGTYE